MEIIFPRIFSWSAFPCAGEQDLPPQETFFSYKIISSEKFSKNA
ncbi:hypothetical protein [Dialister succinatiphilus]